MAPRKKADGGHLAPIEANRRVAITTDARGEAVYLYGTPEGMTELAKVLRRQTELDGHSKIGVGDGSGELFVQGPYEAVKRVQGLVLDGERQRADLRNLEQQRTSLMHERDGLKSAVKGYQIEVDKLRDQLEGARADLHRQAGYIDRILEKEGAMQPLPDADSFGGGMLRSSPVVGPRTRGNYHG